MNISELNLDEYMKPIVISMMHRIKTDLFLQLNLNGRTGIEQAQDEIDVIKLACGGNIPNHIMDSMRLVYKLLSENHYNVKELMTAEEYGEIQKYLETYINNILPS